jgi:hypothetical protein
VPKPTLSALLLACIITLAACGSGSHGMTQEEQFTELMRRPSEEQMVQQYDQMRHEIADKLSAEIGLPPWTVNDNTGGGSLCGHEFGDLGLDAGTKSLSILGTAAPIPNKKWEHAVRITGTIARKNGFGPAQRLVDKAGHHLVDFEDAWGGRLSLGTMVHSSLSVRTGCHLTAAAKQRGTPTPLPEYDR